ncbi:MAG: hypothetical protein CMJ75_12930 [Planctomycetaceae bacterium]|nr:hypothetical protein [Planctomycetaceae bacterium]
MRFGKDGFQFGEYMRASVRHWVWMAVCWHRSRCGRSPLVRAIGILPALAAPGWSRQHEALPGGVGQEKADSSGRAVLWAALT